MTGGGLGACHVACLNGEVITGGCSFFFLGVVNTSTSGEYSRERVGSGNREGDVEER